MNEFCYSDEVIPGISWKTLWGHVDLSTLLTLTLPVDEDAVDDLLRDVDDYGDDCLLQVGADLVCGPGLRREIVITRLR